MSKSVSVRVWDPGRHVRLRYADSGVAVNVAHRAPTLRGTAATPCPGATPGLLRGPRSNSRIHGKFDGAHLVRNFEALNPANTYWKKYYDVWSQIDTEPARFLEFERWWGGFDLFNDQEIRWIVNNLLVQR